ncbi:flagellar basal body rod protein FlgC [Legionella spiritensis]|uniref:Flagellar basal-body rod protein FlgC n=1 Tax=Legionella spiritensis TaxID=452 RepID=A0A0W0Z3Y7_LEGSP|nr:flagellar basal body rod protein FlgC [Legionella spiritensis]KTD63864.1 flagellar basal body rod protein FlgC [Legionella spiritensis]SNV35538.1 flagellar basal-body rod protein FlgC [Legionella spiritensis]VEG89763.1 flagellar basal-body rod protein FlgC [Legionella spiritensis]
MSLNAIFDIAASGLSAETTRMTATASNMTNANVVSGNPDAVYKPVYPIFSAIQQQATLAIEQKISGGVEVTDMFQSNADPVQRYEPNNPLADKDGFVYAPNINHVEEMANMISASRAYQVNLEMISTTKQLMQRTLQLGEGA